MLIYWTADITTCQSGDCVTRTQSHIFSVLNIDHDVRTSFLKWKKMFVCSLKLKRNNKKNNEWVFEMNFFTVTIKKTTICLSITVISRNVGNIFGIFVPFYVRTNIWARILVWSITDFETKVIALKTWKV